MYQKKWNCEIILGATLSIQLRAWESMEHIIGENYFCYRTDYSHVLQVSHFNPQLFK
jgi:hypothetical protein